ncbi:MAG TPA: hypothetical protein VM260_22995, partial [Pirellula sp.]|nr:hypothetical protein [Pirellula sp.]
MTGFLWSDDADAFFGEQPRANSNIRKPASKMPGKTPVKPRPGTSSDAPLSVAQLNAWVKNAIEQSVA